MKTDVIFRRLKTGEIVAMLPSVAIGSDVNLCKAFTMNGKITAVKAEVSDKTVIHSRDYAPLKEKLEKMGYNIRLVRNFNTAHFLMRQKQIKEGI